MATDCYSMVRGSVARFTLLDHRGNPVIGPSSVITTKGITTVAVNEIIESRATALMRTPYDDPRVITRERTNTIGFSADIALCGVDPDLIHMLTGQSRVTNALGDVVGNDAELRSRVVNFSMEVWSKLTQPVDGYSFGYTVFPRIRGGRVSGFSFKNGAIDFAVTGSRTYKNNKWGYGPYDLFWDGGTWNCATPPVMVDLGFGVGPFGSMPFGDSSSGVLRVDYPRQARPVSKNLHWRNMLVAQVPEVAPGAQPLSDVIDNFFSAPGSQTPDILDGGTSASTSSDVVDGGTS